MQTKTFILDAINSLIYDQIYMCFSMLVNISLSVL